jgi:aminoglycoside phosphotransferase (APT) family kinase protein
VWFVESIDGIEVVVKFHAGDARRRIGKERFIYDQAAWVPRLPIPKVLGFDEDAIILSRLPGLALGDAFPTLSPQDLGRLAEQLAVAVRALHSLVQPAFGYLLAWVHEPAETNRDYMKRTFDAFLADWARYGGDPNLAERVQRLVSERADLFDHCRQPVICHDDLNPANILVEKRSEGWDLSGIVDFENARAADPLMDVAKAGYYLFSSMAERLPRGPFIRGYGGLRDHAEELITVYRIWSDLEMWVALARAWTVGWRPALESDLEALVSGKGW